MFYESKQATIESKSNYDDLYEENELRKKKALYYDEEECAYGYSINQNANSNNIFQKYTSAINLALCD